MPIDKNSLTDSISRDITPLIISRVKSWYFLNNSLDSNLLAACLDSFINLLSFVLAFNRTPKSNWFRRTYSSNGALTAPPNKIISLPATSFRLGYNTPSPLATDIILNVNDALIPTVAINSFEKIAIPSVAAFVKATASFPNSAFSSLNLEVYNSSVIVTEKSSGMCSIRISSPFSFTNTYTVLVISDSKKEYVLYSFLENLYPLNNGYIVAELEAKLTRVPTFFNGNLI